VLVHAGYLGAFLIRFGGALPDTNFRAYVQLAPGVTVLTLALFLSCPRALQVLTLLLWRGAVWRVAQRVWGPERVIVCGPPGEAEDFTRRLTSVRMTGWEVLGTLVGRPPGAPEESLSEVAAAVAAQRAPRGDEDGPGQREREDPFPLSHVRHHRHARA